MSSINSSSKTNSLLVHCRLMSGGAFNVVKELLTDFSDVKYIITLISAVDSIEHNNKTYPVISALPHWISAVFSYFQKHRFPLLSWLFDYRNLMFFYPLLVRLMRKKATQLKPQKTIISSFAIAKNIVQPGQDTALGDTILYLHSPMQYIHSHYDEYIKKLTGVKLLLFKSITKPLRHRDTKKRTYNTVYTNSKYTSEQVKQIYGIDSVVAYPSISEVFFDIAVSRPRAYRVATGRLVRLVKEYDRIIELFNEIHVPLLIMGSGPDEVYLKSIAGPTITFLGWIDDEQEKAEILRHAAGFINLTTESFGIATAESLLCGVPVLGYDQGGSAELVDQDTGVLLSSKDHATLVDGYHQFVSKDFDRKQIQETARSLFSPTLFLSG